MFNIIIIIYFLLLCLLLINSSYSFISNKQVLRSSSSSSFKQINMMLNFLSLSPKKKNIEDEKRIKTIGITGSTGLIGTELIKRLKNKGINVIRMKVYGNDIKPTLESLEGLDAIVHLAGENVASGDDKDGILKILGRWTDNKKTKILQSRVDGTTTLVNAISKLKKKPKAFISASAVGYYYISTTTMIIIIIIIIITIITNTFITTIIIIIII